METIPQLFEESIKVFANNTLIREKKDGKYQDYSYTEIGKKVYQFACGLINLGVNPNDRIALFAEGRTEWLVSELGILYVGAIAVPLSVKINEPKELRFRLEHSGCRYIIVSSQQLDKIRLIADSLKDLEKVIVLDEEKDLNSNETTYSKIIAEGVNNFKELEKELNGRWTSLTGKDIANVSYTSGTTADPKGIMLTHLNYISNLEQADSLFKVPSWYTSLLILSWDHSFAHTVGLYVMIKNGASISVVETGKTPMEMLRNIPKNIKEVRPVFQLSVPALARSFKKGIESGIKAKGVFTEKLFHHALKISYRYHGNGFGRKTAKQQILKPLVKLYDQLLFSKVRANFGGRLKFFVGGGALLDIELQHFFYAIGIPMFQGYGLTEASPVISSNTPDIHKLGTSGRVVKNLKIKILDDDGSECQPGEKGEIVVKGGNVMIGYWENSKATSETLKNGWLYTGDLGYLDEDCFLYVLGRFKSLLIGNDGEKYSPEGIEEALVDHSDCIDQSMLYNNQNAYTTGLIVVNTAAISNYLSNKKLDPHSEKGIQEAVNLIYTELDRFNQGGEFEETFPQRWLPAAVAIVEEPFAEANGMINSTLKMVRSKVAEYYAERLNYLYTPDGKKQLNEKNINAMKQLLKSKI